MNLIQYRSGSLAPDYPSPKLKISRPFPSESVNYSAHAKTQSTHNFLMKKTYNTKPLKLIESKIEAADIDSFVNSPGQQQRRKIIVPKNIIIDKEFLYEQLITQKQTNNDLSNQISTLKATIVNLELENSRLQKIDQLDPTKQSNSVNSTYKQELKQKQEEIKKLELQITILKKSTRFSTVQTLEQNLQKSQEQLKAMHIMLDQMKNIKDGVQNDNVVDVLTQDNIEMASIVRIQTEQIQSLTSFCRDLESRYIQLQSKYSGIKRVLYEKEKEIEILRARDPLKDMNLLLNAQNEIKLKQEIDKKNDEINQLQGNLNVSSKKVNDLERKIKEIQLSFTEKYNQMEKEKIFFKEKCDKTIRELYEMQDRMKLADRMQGGKKKIQQLSERNVQEDAGNRDEDEIFQMNIGNRVQKVEKSDIQKICQELRLKLRNQGIELKDIDLYLFDEQNLRTQSITIRELDELFQLTPFKIQDSKSRRLLARYLVEDNAKNEYLFDENLNANISYVRSTFKTAMNNYMLFTETQKWKEEIQLVLKQYKAPIQEYLIKRKGNDQNSPKQSIENLIDVIKILELPLTNRHIDFIFQFIYDNYNTIDQFEPDRFFMDFEKQMDKQENEDFYNFIQK